jgi:hypothetical protein
LVTVVIVVIVVTVVIVVIMAVNLEEHGSVVVQENFTAEVYGNH